MSTGAQFLTLVGFAGVIQGLFFGSFIFQLRKGNILSNRLFALLLLSVSLKALISAIIYYTKGNVHDALPVTGVAMTLVAGPLLYMYVRCRTNALQINAREALHFAPAVVFLIASGFAVNKIAAPANLASLAHMLAYVFVAVAETQRKPSHDEQKSWFRLLLACMLIFAIAYIFNAFQILCIILCPMFYALLIYILSYAALRYYRVFVQAGPSRASRIDFSLPVKRLNVLMHDKKIYKDAGLQLAVLSRHVGLSVHDMSHLLNEHMGQSFSDYINSYRLEEARVMLASESHRHLKIAAVAMECGFNSLSVFNVAFKKTTGCTPSQYRAKFLM